MKNSQAAAISVDGVELATSIKQMQSEMQEMKEKVSVTPPGFPPAAGSSRSSGGHLDEIPPEKRPYARIGNLGWDPDSQLLLTRATDVLEQAGVEKKDYSCLAAVRTKGSIVSLTFQDPRKLQDAKRRIRTLGIKQDGLDKPVWLDVEKSFQELKPARVINRAHDLIEDLESRRDDPQAVEKIMNGKQINLGGKIVAWSFRGALTWANIGIKRYSEEERQQVTAFAEN